MKGDLSKAGARQPSAGNLLLIRPWEPFAMDGLELSKKNAKHSLAIRNHKAKTTGKL
jgi:hypothetical protein